MIWAMFSCKTASRCNKYKWQGQQNNYDKKSFNLSAYNKAHSIAYRDSVHAGDILLQFNNNRYINTGKNPSDME